MNADTFLKEFGHLADAPDGVQKLRDMVLRLAVQGKLVEQRENDVRAHEILTHIDSRLLMQHNLEAKVAGHLPIDSIPGTWCWAPTSRLCNLETGKRMKGGARSEGVISLGGEHLKPDGTVDYSVPRYISDEFFNELRKGRVRVGDTLMVKDGATTGKTAFVTQLPPDHRAAVNEHVFILRWMHPIEPKLAFYFIRAFAYSDIATKSSGIIGGIKRDAVLNFMFPLPPLAEQKRIVATVDGLMALCDELEARQTKRNETRVRLNNASLDALVNAQDPDELAHHWSRLRDNFGLVTDDAECVTGLRKSVIGLAVRGAIDIQNETEGSATSLLDRIEQEVEQLVGQGEIKRPKPVKPIDGEEFAFELPKSWVAVRAGQLFTFVTSGSRGWAKYYSDSGATFLRIGNLDYGTTELDLRNIQHVKPPLGAEGRRTQTAVGDILISITGDTGMVGVVPKSLGEAYINQHIALARPSVLLSSRYLALYFMSDISRDFLTLAQRGIKNSLGLDDIRNIPVSLPPVPEQKRIVAKVDELMILCDDLESKLAAAQATSQRLLGASITSLVA